MAGCSHMSARHYLPLRHYEVAKTVRNSHLRKFHPSKEIKFSSEPEYTYEKDHQEYWRNVSVKTARKLLIISQTRLYGTEKLKFAA